MLPRHTFASRWLSQFSDLVQHAPTSPLSKVKISRPVYASPSPTFRRGLSLPANATLHLQGRSFRSQIQFGKSAAQNLTRRPQSATFRRFFNSSRTKRSSSQSEESASLSQRLKTLSREYGWSALWVYLLLSAMDFPFCFAAVRLLGVERIGHYEHVIFESVKGAIDTVWSRTPETPTVESQVDGPGSKEPSAEEAPSKPDGEASLWTQLALAYAIHKSFIFIRVPLTAAITPKVVKVLRQWGWDIVKGKPRGM
ncbi:hypothetical protein P170DRAFT_431954 [Aspergillus steynii IBT 23096]|uniref:DUF1279 domain-containing protein n=1 Tax=Aspergillus steynii IBT 23096 TaxID=1392250 RepID=A0A2I2GN77_9EURO|nr:uncharacterized protein P170DRAFT_431954 [Aspergillus steynii IBT 23096]PLB54323.1 hypothetical protein P170DRAFT_431954 [Aspergillus steynii IBT 23096]